MPPRPPEDLCECFGWGSDYMTTSGHHLNCEKRIAHPATLKNMLGSLIKEISDIWKLHGASDVETLETAHYVISKMKRDLEMALRHARANQ